MQHPIEVCFHEARQDAGVGQARNWARRAVERTVPFGLVRYSLAIVWYTHISHIGGCALFTGHSVMDAT